MTTVAQDSGLEPAAPSSSASTFSINAIYRRAAGAVVRVDAAGERVENDFFFGEFRIPSQAQGSGFVIDDEGRIVTNYHVVADAQSVQVSFSNNERMSARVVGVDPATDLALLDVEADAGALRPLEFGDSDDVRVGDPVVAIGNPLGLERTVTAGIVSALQRRITAPVGETIDHVIQTDAPINPGSSGGPLLNANGDVIGVNSQISTADGSRGNIGIGFAVPSNTVKTVVEQLIESGQVERPFLGIEAVTLGPEAARVFSLPAKKGLLVEKVCPGSAADKAGIRAGTTEVVVAGRSYVLGGDIIVAIDGEDVTSADALRRALSEHRPGDEITVELYRTTADGAKRLELEVELAGAAAAPAC